MELSSRITNITGGGSDGWDVFYKARRMIDAGVNVTELTIGEHDIRTAPDILGAMYKAAVAGHTGYAAVPGTDSLRRAVAHRIAERTGVPTTRDNILITPGGQAALFAAHMAACNPGDTALFIDPYYATYPGTLRGVGAVPRAIVTAPDTNFEPTAAALSAVAPGARSLLINTPNNPTGVVYAPETLVTIARTCQDHDLWLISDEVYDTQVWQGQHISPRSLPGMADRTLVVGSMSKSHAMTGSRIGWVIGPAEVLEHMGHLATNTTYGVAGFVQEAASFALDQGEAFEEQIGEPFRRRRDLVLGLVGAQNVVRAIPADGAMYIMLDMRATGLSGEEFAKGLLETHHVAVMPGESFGQAAAGHVRVALTVNDKRLAEAVQHILDYAALRAA